MRFIIKNTYFRPGNPSNKGKVTESYLYNGGGERRHHKLDDLGQIFRRRLTIDVEPIIYSFKFIISPQDFSNFFNYLDLEKLLLF